MLRDDKGVKIGEVPMSKETKGSWSELFLFNNELISVIFYDPSSCYIADGELVNEKEITMYTDTPEETIELYNKLKS